MRIATHAVAKQQSPMPLTRAGEHNLAELQGRLPPYLLSRIIEYGAGRDFSFVLRLGGVSKAFLEALAFVEVLHVDVLQDQRFARHPSELMEYDGVLLSHRYDDSFKRWCEVACARLRNVTFMHDGGGIGSTFNATQTREIIGCAASFPNLTGLLLSDCDPSTACASIAAHVRDGRFTRLKCLDISDPVPNFGGPCLYYHLVESAEARQSVKRAMRDLFGHLPVNLALSMHLGGEWVGLYPWLLEQDDEYDTWRSELIELIDRGADLATTSTLIRFLDDLRFVPSANYNDWNHAHLETAFSTIKMLLDRGADARTNLSGHWRGNALNCLVNGLNGSIGLEHRRPELAEPLYRVLMRTIDLLLRHRVVDNSLSLYRTTHVTNIDIGAWILARPDCTQLLRQDVLRHAMLHRDDPGRERFPTAVDTLVDDSA